MMTAKDALVRLLLNATSLDASVGNRWYPQWAPEDDTLPYGCVSTITRTREHNMDGPSGLVKCRIQVDVFAQTQRAADQIGDLVRLVLDGYTGTVTAGAESIYLDAVLLDNDLEDVEREDEPSEDRVARVTLDFFVSHKETLPSRP